MKKLILKRIILILTIIMLLNTNISILGYGLKCYAEDNSKNNSETKNVEVVTYFKNENGKNVNEISKSINDTEIKLYAQISVKTEGYFNGTLELKDSNFNIENEILCNGISSISDNKVYLKQINAGETVNIELKVKPIILDTLNTNMLSQESLLNLTGKYIEKNNKERKVDITNAVRLDLKVPEKQNAELKSNIITNEKLIVNGEEKRVIQLSIDSRLENNSYPVKETIVNLTNLKLTSKVDNKTVEPEQVKVLSLGTLATNGESSKAIENISKIDDNTLQFKIENEPNTNNEIQWKKNVYDRFVVTYIFDKDVDADKVELKSSIEISIYNGQNKYTAEYKKGIENTERNNIVIGETNNYTESIYKGQLYANINNENVKKDVEYKNSIKINITTENVVDSITVTEKVDNFILKDSQEISANSYFRKIEVSKEKIKELFGEDGYITINNIVLNKDSEVNANGNIEVIFNDNVTEVKIVTSKPIKAGILEIINTKAITGKGFSKQVISQVDKIKSIIELENVQAKNKYTNTINSEIQLQDTVTKAELNIIDSKGELSTLNENKIVLGVKLVTENEQYDLYKNPVIKIKLPNEVEKFTLNNSDKLYAEGFSIQAECDQANKTITLKLNGEQKEYPSTSATQIYLQLDLTLILSKTAPKKNEKIIMQYQNENALKYFGDTEVGVATQEIGISSPVGLIAMYNVNTYGINTISGISADSEKIQVLRNDGGKNVEFEMTLLNNTGKDISNVKILGILPNAGTKKEEILSSTLSEVKADNCSIYYTQNPNATTDLNNIQNGWTTTFNANSKMFLIVLNGELKKENSYSAKYTIVYPSEIDTDVEAISQYKVIYDNDQEKDNQVKSTSIKFATPREIKMEANMVAQVGGTTLNSGDIVKVGEVIKYVVTIKNTGSQPIENVNVKSLVPDGTVLVEPEEGYEHSGASYYKELNDKEKEIKINSLKADETYKYEYEVRVKSNNNEIINKVQAKCEDVKIESTEIKNKIEDAPVRVTIKNADESDKVQGNTTTYIAIIENLTNTELKNYEISLDLSGINVTEIVKDDETEITNNFKLIKIDSILANETTYFSIKGEVEKNVSEITAVAVVNDKNGNKYRSNKVSEEVLKEDATITMYSENENAFVEQGKEIIYNITVENTGNAPTNVTINDTISNYLKIKEIYVNDEKLDDFYKNENDFSYMTCIEKGQKLNIKIVTEVYDIYGKQFETLEISNIAELVVNGEVKKTEEIIHTILGREGVNYTKPSEDDSNNNNNNNNSNNNSNNNNGNNNNNSNNSNNNNNNNNGNNSVEEKTYIISGTAWIDENMNGEKDEKDSILSGVTVRVYDVNKNDYLKDKNGNIIETNTDENGKYTILSIPEGQYIVLFKFDNNKYETTTYQKDGIAESKNSNVVLKTIKIDGQELLYAVTDTIDLKGNISNINIGLKQKVNFDLELNKYISKITVQNSKETKSYDFDNQKFAKIEINGKQLSSSTVILEYTIQIKNTGDIAGYASNIVDYLPNGLEFSSELNDNWYLLDGNLYTKQLENVRIEPGEIKEVKVVLTKLMTEDNVGLINNRAEIFEEFNEYGIADIDSTPNNQDNNEDDIGAADVYIGIKTGGTTIAIYTIIVLINLVLIAMTLRLIITKDAGFYNKRFWGRR